MPTENVYGMNPEGFKYKGQSLDTLLLHYFEPEHKRLKNLLAMERPEWWDDEVGKAFAKYFHEYGNITLTMLEKIMKAMDDVVHLTNGTSERNKVTEELNTGSAMHFGNNVGGKH